MEKRDRVIVGIVVAVALIIIPAALFFGGNPAPVSILTPHIQKHIKTHIQGWAKPHTTELVKEPQAEFQTHCRVAFGILHICRVAFGIPEKRFQAAGLPAVPARAPKLRFWNGVWNHSEK